jgi:hypothetical protein
VEQAVSASDLKDALKSWALQREQVALLMQAFSLTLPAHAILVHGMQANRHDSDVTEKKFAELHLESADRLATELQELARRARHCQALRASFDRQGVEALPRRRVRLTGGSSANDWA